MPTQEEIDEAIRWAAFYEGPAGAESTGDVRALRILAAYARAEKARADLLERQYHELDNWWKGNISECRADFQVRHVAERAALGSGQ